MTAEDTPRTVEEVRTGGVRRKEHTAARKLQPPLSSFCFLSHFIAPHLTLSQQLELVIVAALAMASVTGVCAKYEIFFDT